MPTFPDLVDGTQVQSDLKGDIPGYHRISNVNTTLVSSDFNFFVENYLENWDSS